MVSLSGVVRLWIDAAPCDCPLMDICLNKDISKNAILSAFVADASIFSLSEALIASLISSISR